jgi:hypothetical protein
MKTDLALQSKFMFTGFTFTFTPAEKLGGLVTYIK